MSNSRNKSTNKIKKSKTKTKESRCVIRWLEGLFQGRSGIFPCQIYLGLGCRLWIWISEISFPAKSDDAKFRTSTIASTPKRSRAQWDVPDCHNINLTLRTTIIYSSDQDKLEEDFTKILRIFAWQTILLSY